MDADVDDYRIVEKLGEKYTVDKNIVVFAFFIYIVFTGRFKVPQGLEIRYASAALVISSKYLDDMTLCLWVGNVCDDSNSTIKQIRKAEKIMLSAIEWNLHRYYMDVFFPHE
jgi:hypothetical protein